ncbi:hypothetical protein J6590_067477 [Homalodisca vitripennis]|nr:hypothetical protein J6590_067477 [Homalodisca vitripennis]
MYTVDGGGTLNAYFMALHFNGEVDDEDEEKGKAKGEGKDGSTMRTRCPTHHSPPRQGRGREGAVDPQLSHSSNTDISQVSRNPSPK